MAILGRGQPRQAKRRWIKVPGSTAPKVWIRVGGSWVQVSNVKVRVGGAWVTPTNVYVRVAGAWVKI